MPKQKYLYGMPISDGYVDCGYMNIHKDVLELDPEGFVAHLGGMLLLAIGRGEFNRVLREVVLMWSPAYNNFRRSKSAYLERIHRKTAKKTS